MELDLLIFPIHLGNHWVCQAIDFERKRVQCFDSLGKENQLIDVSKLACYT